MVAFGGAIRNELGVRRLPKAQVEFVRAAHINGVVIRAELWQFALML